MPLALIAKFTVSQQRILNSQWTHDIIHAFVTARQNALARLEDPRPAPPARP